MSFSKWEQNPPIIPSEAHLFSLFYNRSVKKKSIYLLISPSWWDFGHNQAVYCPQSHHKDTRAEGSSHLTRDKKGSRCISWNFDRTLKRIQHFKKLTRMWRWITEASAEISRWTSFLILGYIHIYLYGSSGLFLCVISGWCERHRIRKWSFKERLCAQWILHLFRSSYVFEK